MIRLFQMVFCITVILLSSLGVNAKSMRVIAFCNTNDNKIGQAAVVSHDMFNNELSYLAYLLGYDFDFRSFVGDECSKENLEKMISSVTSSPDDIVVFYYFGHGTRAADQESKFPQMCLKYEIYDENKFVPVQYVINRLQKQPAHLKLIVSMCCNNVVGGISPKNTMCEAMGPTTLGGTDIENYRKLFDNFNGTLAITGSQPGQYSWCNSMYGGIFDVVFWAVMEAVGEGELAADWNTVFEAVKRQTDQIAYRSTDPPTHQEPYFDIMPGNNGGNNGGGNRTFDPPTTNDDLQNAISRMIGTPNTDKRIEMVDDIINKYFSGNNSVFVQLLGRNMHTIVDTMDMRSYLRSVALSDKILRINNLGTTNINNNTVYKFHEIRK